MRIQRTPLAIALSILLSVLLTACGDDDSTGPPADGTFNGIIRVQNNRFSPATVTISAGDSVTWRWEGNGHTVTQGTSPSSPPPAEKLFDSGPQNSGSTFGFRFNDPGTVRYFCAPHLSAGMTGTITVQ